MALTIQWPHSVAPQRGRSVILSRRSQVPTRRRGVRLNFNYASKRENYTPPKSIRWESLGANCHLWTYGRRTCKRYGLRTVHYWCAKKAVSSCSTAAELWLHISCGCTRIHCAVKLDNVAINLTTRVRQRRRAKDAVYYVHTTSLFAAYLRRYAVTACWLCIANRVMRNSKFVQNSDVTPIGQGWTNARGLRGLGGPGLTLFVYFNISRVRCQPSINSTLQLIFLWTSYVHQVLCLMVILVSTLIIINSSVNSKRGMGPFM